MDWMIMLAQLLLSLSLLVAVHEFGHLIAAKYFGMRVEQFSIGFPPKIWSFKKGETEYAISAVPLGGYVKISGMIDESLDAEAMKQPPQPWEFRSKPAWQRLIVMLGGKQCFRPDQFFQIFVLVAIDLHNLITCLQSDAFSHGSDVKSAIIIDHIFQQVCIAKSERDTDEDQNTDHNIHKDATQHYNEALPCRL